MTIEKPDAAAARRHREAQLDEALKESFPASDPPAIQVVPANPSKPRRRKPR